MRRFFLFLVMISVFRTVSSQEGAPLLTHFRENRETENQNWAICQDRNNFMLFANRKGILCFDGEEWSPIRLPVTPYILKMNPSDQKIYVGGENDYGILEKDQKGNYLYHSLKDESDSSDNGSITRIFFNDSISAFYSEKAISFYNFRKGSLTHILYSGEDTFTGMFMSGKNIFVNVWGKGLFRIVKDTLLPTVGGYFTENTEILFSLPYNETQTLLGFSNGKMSLFDGKKYTDYQIKDDGYLSGNILYQGIAIGDSLYAFSTLEGGALVINRTDGKVMFTINNQNGLPDDEVFAIGSDAGGGLWLSHPFGLSRADLKMPVRNFSIYPGLKGNLTTSVDYNKELYVGTSEGIFYLANEKKYTEVEVFRENKIKPVMKPVSEKTMTEPEISVKKPNERKNIFRRIFGKKDATPDNKSASETPSRNKKVSEEKPLPEYSTQKIKKLKSIDYVYKKVTGLNDKCRQLVATKNGVLAATNRGLYVINNHNATLISGESYINHISWEPEGGVWFIATAEGWFSANFRNGKWLVETHDKDFNAPVYSIVQDGGKNIWLGSDNIAYKVAQGTGKEMNTYERYSVINNFSQKYLLAKVNDSIFLLTETGINVFNGTRQKFEEYNISTSGSDLYETYIYPMSNIPLFHTGEDWVSPGKNKKIRSLELSLLRLFDNVVSVDCEKNNIWVIDDENNLYGIDRRTISRIPPCNDLIIKNIHNEKGTVSGLSDIVFERGDNVINFDIIVPAYLKKNLIQYQYYIDKVMPEWSKWSNQTSYSRGVPGSGDYTLLVRARDIWGRTIEPMSVHFTIKAPFTKTTLFYILILAAVLFVIFAVVNFREKQLQEKNLALEEKVRQRTAEIEAQKGEITASIEYASRIQRAMLPVPSMFTEFFSDYFIIFQPRDIVSGDFYWIGEDEKRIFLTVADCTGHGVPGAFMSALGISVLNEIITHNAGLQANKVLNLMREKIKTALHQTGKEGETADGMDISLIVLEKNRKNLQFSGAYNPLFFCNNGELKEYKADRMPIGIHYGDESPFTNNEIKIKKGDIIYLLSDGFIDQFGGDDGSKFKKAQLKNLLFEIHNMPMKEQKKHIENEFLKWKGRNDQIDDITIIGVKI